MDMLKAKNISPMMIAKTVDPFDSTDWLYELKLDGERCIAYLDTHGTTLINSRKKHLLPYFPEFKALHSQSATPCILDGEIIFYTGSGYDFKEVMRRGQQRNTLRREYDAAHSPASFIAFDILYHAGKPLTARPLHERKQILEAAITESERLSVSRTVEEHGVELFRLTVQQNLEGVVAKRKSSLYTPGKRTHDWVKFKNWLDDEYIICGFIPSQKVNTAKIILAQYDENGSLVYKGHVVLGMATNDFVKIRSLAAAKLPFKEPLPTGNDGAIWVQPKLVCTVRFIDYTPSGKMRQPQYKALRPEKAPAEVTEREWSIRF